ncbi:MAG: hypothetical protein OXJ52_03505, partial [Oligoflexia bacterium]|nr:hypothetical protein [Oligoflexia bacterium]
MRACLVFFLVAFFLCIPLSLVDSLSNGRGQSATAHYTVQSFLEYVFENTDCYCEGNNGCTRGCRKADQITKGDSPQVRRCFGKKPLSYSREYCARHINSAIMNVFADFLSPYCEKSAPYFKGYQQCVDDFHLDIRNRRINICQHSFVFPSALCMLNLDGKNVSIYDSISDKGVRGSCRAWDRYNQMLYTFSIPILDPIEIPLFKKIDDSKYT